MKSDGVTAVTKLALDRANDYDEGTYRNHHIFAVHDVKNAKSERLV